MITQRRVLRWLFAMLVCATAARSAEHRAKTSLDSHAQLPSRFTLHGAR